MKAFNYLTNVLHVKSTRCGMISYGEDAREQADTYSMNDQGHPSFTFKAKAVFRVDSKDRVVPLGPGFIVAKRHPKHVFVADGGLFYAEVDDSVRK